MFTTEGVTVLGTIAAPHVPRVALVRGLRGKRGGDRSVTWAKTPTNRSGRCGDTARGNEDHDKRDEGFVEHSREELDGWSLW